MNSTGVPGGGALSGDAMLPFSLWSVADLVDGQRSVNAIAAALNLPVSAVMKLLSAIEGELGAPLPIEVAALQPPPPPPETSSSGAGAGALTLLAQLAVDLVGPMGELMLEDVLDELGEEASAHEVARRVAQELHEPQRGAFLTRARAKGLL